MSANRVVYEERSTPERRLKQSFQGLLGIAADAVRMPPFYFSSIFGLPWTWVLPHRRYSEFSIIDVWKLQRTVKYLLNVSIPSLPRTPLPFGPPILDDLFWEPTVILQRPDHNGSYTTFLDESWFFINGILTNDAVAQINAACLAELFHRPITLIQNATNSFLVDLVQCALGKEWDRTVEPAIKAFEPVYEALKSGKKRVVVIAHSQGTLIAARLLELLYSITFAAEIAPEASQEGMPGFRERAFAAPEAAYPAPPEFVYPDQSQLKLGDFAPLTEDELARLEVYCFANCANRMKYYRPTQNGHDPIPWIENFGNEHDLVARLGMLAPEQEKREIEIDGPCYLREKAWGHLLDEHYLFPITDFQKAGRRKGGVGGTAPFRLIGGQEQGDGAAPRLYGYINGGPER
jgi:hypothetical protein